MRERMQPALSRVAYRVGMRVPRTARLYTVPETVAVEVPAIKTYKTMMVNNRVVLVDPATSEVVDEFTTRAALADGGPALSAPGRVTCNFPVYSVYLSRAGQACSGHKRWIFRASGAILGAEEFRVCR